MTKLHRLLVKLGACKEAIAFANGKELAEAWATCERPDWMMWLCSNMMRKKGWPTHQQVVLCACDCAETVLPIFEGKYPKESSPRVAIETARKWVNGEASLEEVRDAAAYASAASDAAAAAAADAAANAASAAVYAAHAAYAADDAAYTAAAYASAASDAAAAAAAYAAANAARAAARAAAHAAYTAANAADDADVTYRITLADKRKELANLIRNHLIIPTENKNGTRTQSKL